ncbi:MAG TPA: cation-transporting P-type ATPase, partial [Syntrophales bacterium]|nr:cation-transporting P-type ATPase [Syntrophales bacterium]
MPQTIQLNDPSVMDVGTVAEALGTDLENGLASKEAARRRSKDGPNELRTATRMPAWKRFLTQFQDPLIYLLLIAIVISLTAWVIEGRSGFPVDAVVIALIVVLNGFL